MTNQKSQIEATKQIQLNAYDDTQEDVLEKTSMGTLIDGSELFIKNAFETNPELGAELLFKTYYQALCTHTVRYVYSKEVAEDLVCDVFFTFWNNQSYKNVTTSFRAYLFRSVRNRAFNYLSNELKRNDSIDSASNFEASSSDLPQQMMQFEELYHQIDAIVDSLPTQCRRVFLMNRFEGKKPKEIAIDLQISIRTVETHIQKALSTLKSKLKDIAIISILIVLFS